MTTHRRCRIAPVIALGLLLAAPPASTIAQEPQTQQEPGPAERAGAQLDRLLGQLQENFRELSDEVRQRFAQAQQRVEGLGIEARVYSRLRWDKALSDAEIAVEVQENHVVVLHGSVADAELKRKAVRLTVETVGVDRVKDNLVIAEPADDEAAP